MLPNISVWSLNTQFCLTTQLFYKSYKNHEKSAFNLLLFFEQNYVPFKKFNIVVVCCHNSSYAL